jgi:hypothetical protein
MQTTKGVLHDECSLEDGAVNGTKCGKNISSLTTIFDAGAAVLDQVIGHRTIDDMSC